jgi:hypothetical protein
MLIKRMKSGQPKAILYANAAMLLWGAIARAQVIPDVRALTLNGSARMVQSAYGPVLRLTSAHVNQTGSAFTSSSFPVNAFSLFFQFRITDAKSGYGPGDGIAFVLQTEGANALGAGGGSLGYGGIAPSVAVEFDTYQNSFDINDNHVAILTNGVMTDLDPQTPYPGVYCGNYPPPFGCMSDGDIWSVWIDYDGTNLYVALADKSTTRPPNLITYPIDISGILGQNSAFIGFTAACGDAYENQYIFNVRWKYPSGL